MTPDANAVPAGKQKPREWWICDGRIFVTAQEAYTYQGLYAKSVSGNCMIPAVIHVREVIDEIYVFIYHEEFPAAQQPTETKPND